MSETLWQEDDERKSKLFNVIVKILLVKELNVLDKLKK